MRYSALQRLSEFCYLLCLSVVVCAALVAAVDRPRPSLLVVRDVDHNVTTANLVPVGPRPVWLPEVKRK